MSSVFVFCLGVWVFAIFLGSMRKKPLITQMLADARATRRCPRLHSDLLSQPLWRCCGVVCVLFKDIQKQIASTMSKKNLKKVFSKIWVICAHPKANTNLSFSSA